MSRSMSFTRDQEQWPVGQQTKPRPNKIFLRCCLSHRKECISTYAIAKQFALKEFVWWDISCFHKIQHKCVLFSIVQDFSPIIYYSGQMSFTTVFFSESMFRIRIVYWWHVRTTIIHQDQDQGDKSLALTREANIATPSSVHSSEDIRESGSRFLSNFFIVCLFVNFIPFNFTGVLHRVCQILGYLLTRQYKALDSVQKH